MSNRNVRAEWCPETMTVGEGDYSWSSHTRIYGSWMNMMERCYNLKKQIKQPTYEDCEVDLSWHDFQVFAEWYEENYPMEPFKQMMTKQNGEQVEITRMIPRVDDAGNYYRVDKDMKYYGNRTYSAGGCLIIPRALNNLFIASDAARGELPLGISLNRNQYLAQCNDGTGKLLQKYFYDLNEAIDWYWEQKGLRVDEAMRKWPHLSGYIWNYFINFKSEHDPRVI